MRNPDRTGTKGIRRDKKRKGLWPPYTRVLIRMVLQLSLVYDAGYGSNRRDGEDGFEAYESPEMPGSQQCLRRKVNLCI